MNKLVWMLYALLFSTTPLALLGAPIDSGVSGVYLGPDRVCRVVLSQYTAVLGGTPRPWWVQVDLRCTTFAGVQTYSLTTVWSPNTCPQGGAYWLNPWPLGPVPEYLSLRSFNPADQTLQVIVGMNNNAVYDGLLPYQTWYRVAPVASPAPYSCGATSRK